MKKILAYLMVGIAFTGCNSLDLEPISSIADNKYWQTEAQVDAFNVGLHSKFREKCSYSIFLFGEPRADYYFGESTFGSATQGNERMWNNSLNDVNTVVSNFGNLYEVINQANLMINKVEGMSMNESTKKYYLGEVYGIRAFLYFQLLRSYGDVVMWTDFSEGSSLDLGNLARPASSAADVMKLIVDDLQASETAFGDNYGFRNDSQRYFWSKAATMMLKGEVYMWRGKHMGGGNEDYATAKNALQEVRNQTDKFGLLEDFSEVFSYDNKNNKEIIFAIRNARDEYNMWVDVTYNNNMFPQQNILFGYMDENGNPISSLGDKVKVNGTIRYPVNKDVYTKCFNDNDTRKRSTLQAAYEKKEDGTLSLYGLYPAKFLGTLLDGADTRSPLDDYPVYRYADCLLLLAQAKAFLGEDPVEEINAVRKRAYGEDYFNAHPEVQYPNDNDAALYADNKSVKPDNAGAMEAVLKERMREFMVEGKRWYDLRLAGDEYVLEHTTAEATRLLWPIDKNTRFQRVNGEQNLDLSVYKMVTENVYYTQIKGKLRSFRNIHSLLKLYSKDKQQLIKEFIETEKIKIEKPKDILKVLKRFQ